MCNPTDAVSSADPRSSEDAPNGEQPTPASLRLQPPPDTSGSSVAGAIFNFTNVVVGAGAIGLGGAFADSGGLISVGTILFFAVLTKLSLDLVVSMSVEHSQIISSSLLDDSNNMRSATYEELGYFAFGQIGLVAVLVSKFLYSFGCMIAYIIVIKDNFTPALQHFIYGDGSNDTWFNNFLSKDGAAVTITWLLGSFVILPLCLLRDMTPLSSLGAVSVASMVSIVGIVIYIYLEEPSVREKGGSTYENWFHIRPGYVESWGTFVFTFVSQHTVNLAFESLKPEIRTVKTWKTVSTWSLCVATGISLTVGVVVYMTFWQLTRSDLFDMYPPMRIIDLAKLLLCVTMLLSFPLPFFSCRELLIVSLIRPCVMRGDQHNEVHEPEAPSTANNNSRISMSNDDESGLQDPLLSNAASAVSHHPTASEAREQPNTDSNSVEFEDQRQIRCNKLLSMFGCASGDCSVMLPGEEKQLSLPFHVALSVIFWGISTFLAIVSPNLGDILDLVGAASGTAMAFILPGLLSFKLQGYTTVATFILVIGGAVGVVGTVSSVKKLIMDI